MKKTLAGFALVVLFALRGFAVEVKARVINTEGRPVAAAVVLHRPSGAKTVTDEKGHFRLSIPGADKVTIEVIHPDYLEEEITLSSRDLTRPVTITLIPYIKQREEIVVTAMRYPEPSAKVPAAGSVVSTETLQETMPSNVARALQVLPGVAELGSGGFSLVPSIRGLARRRVLLMVDGARLSSDRRTGPSASFISPEDVERIEVLRSPSSVFYGSDAIGGVVHILTREPKAPGRIRGELNARYGTVNQEKGLGLSLEGGRSALSYLLSFQGVDAEDFRSPAGRVLQSHFAQSSLSGKIRHQSEDREVLASLLLARGLKIGKPNRTSAANPTWYPHDNQNLLQLRWQEKNVWQDGAVTFHLFANPNFLETRSDKIATYKSQESYSRTESTDYGLQLSLDKRASSSFRITAGLDWYGRARAGAVNEEKDFDPSGTMTGTSEERPYARGDRRDIGLFLSGDYDGLKNFDLVGGVRLDFLSSRANPGGATEASRNTDRALTGFLAGSAKLGEKLVLFANVSRAYRAPDINERFYSGITGRGFIIANPVLIPESSLSLDAGLKLIERRFFAALYAFSYELKNMIERYRVADRTYTYGNIESGRIRGIEMEWQYFPRSGLSVFGNWTLVDGESLKSNVPLNDIPPQRLFLGTRVWLGRLSFEAEVSFQKEKNDPGPAEIAIPSARYINLRAFFFLAPAVNFYFCFSNLFDESYFARPDPESVEEPGRNFQLGITYSF